MSHFLTLLKARFRFPHSTKEQVKNKINVYKRSNRIEKRVSSTAVKEEYDEDQHGPKETTNY
jgi:hypothetical protein